MIFGGIGFNELYVQKATFGAAPWPEYFALLAWGFGTEATRDALIKFAQGFGASGAAAGPGQGG